MRILSRYIFREIFASSILATILATAVIYLQSLSKLFELMLRSGHALVALQLFALSIPPVLLQSIPLGFLVGTLIGLGRMSVDNEMIALRAAGVSTRTVAPPVIFFACLGMLVSGACAVWLNPIATRAEYKLINKLGATEAAANVVAHVFAEQFTNDKTVLYVDEVPPAAASEGTAVWKGVIIADVTPADQRKTGLKDQGTGPKFTLAEEAVATADPAHNRIILSLKNQSIHESPYHSSATSGALVLEEPPRDPKKARTEYQPMLIRELITAVKSLPAKSPEGIEARLELNRRFALPFACLMLALVGIPLGVSSRKGGRSAGYIWAIFLAFFCYYLSFITLTYFAQSGYIGPILASWLPNIVFGAAGIFLIARMETPGDSGLAATLRASVDGWLSAISRLFNRKAESAAAPGFRILLFQLVDNYVLSSFLFYFVVALFAFVAMAQTYTFFELLADIVRHHIPMGRVAMYHLFLTPRLIYDILPEAVLVAVLVTFGVMTKNNEVTAFKACGVSVRRLGIPVLLMTVWLSGAIFAADYSWIPRANQIQDSIRNEIKGRPPQTYKHPRRKWVIHNRRVFYYKEFDGGEGIMLEPRVFEIDPKFRLTRQIEASRARWQPDMRTWVFEQGVSKDLCGLAECRVNAFAATTFDEITETPDDFLNEVKQSQQMNYRELKQYIDDLRDGGVDTHVRQVEYYKKFTVPLFALTIALISIPFGSMVGNRGAMTAIGVSLVLALAYLGVGQLFEQMGNVRYLPPLIAAWAPNAIFSVTGLYMMLRMRS